MLISTLLIHYSHCDTSICRIFHVYQQYRELNSQVCEQGNAMLKRIKDHLAYFTKGNFLIHVNSKSVGTQCKENLATIGSYNISPNIIWNTHSNESSSCCCKRMLLNGNCFQFCHCLLHCALNTGTVWPYE